MYNQLIYLFIAWICQKEAISHYLCVSQKSNVNSNHVNPTKYQELGKVIIFKTTELTKVLLERKIIYGNLIYQKLLRRTCSISRVNIFLKHPLCIYLFLSPANYKCYQAYILYIIQILVIHLDSILTSALQLNNGKLLLCK